MTSQVAKNGFIDLLTWERLVQPWCLNLLPIPAYRWWKLVLNMSLEGIHETTRSEKKAINEELRGNFPIWINASCCGTIL